MRQAEMEMKLHLSFPRETQSETGVSKSQTRELTLHLVVNLLGPHLTRVALRALEDDFHQLAHRACA